MSDLHRNSRFLRFLRSICSKTACARRAIVALFVAVATILATFMIMPSASMGASQQGEPKQVQTQAEKPENKPAETSGAAAKNGSAASGETAAKGDAGDSKTVDPKNPQPSTNPDAPNADHAQNVDSEKKQNPAVEDAKKDADERAKKEESAKESRLQERSVKEENRAANGGVELPKECKDAGITELAKCYVAEYFYTIKRKKGVAIKKSITINSIGESHTITPVFRRVKKINNKGIPTIDEKTDASSSVKGLIESFSLERLSTESTALESNVENNDFVKVDPTSGEIKIHANKWLNNGSYYVFVKVKYKDNSTLTRSQWCTNSCSPSYNKYSRFSIQIRYKNPTNDVLSLKVYNHQEQDADRAEVDEKKGVTFTSGEDGRFSPITPIFIDTTSSKRPNLIYHRMVCHKDGDETKDSDYYLNSINGLTLSASASSTGQTTQKQWKHVPGVRPDDNKLSESSGNLYESDDIIERSQSWITGTPKEAGTFICKVLALKDIKVSSSTIKVDTPTFVSVFDSKINDSRTHLKQNLFDNNVKVEKIFSAYVSEADAKADLPYNPYGIFETTYERKKVWDVKTIKIVFKSKQQPGDNDLTLKVYPFKGSKTELTGENNKISAMLGMELKPFVDATSAADSANKITLRVLCKGEKKNAAGGGGVASTGGDGSTESGSAGSGSSGTNTGTGSQAEQSSGSSQPAKPPQAEEPLEYKTWSSNLADLGLSVPADTDQTRCKKGDTGCTAAAQTTMDVSINPTKVGNYQCVVFALKNDALTKFDDVISKATQSGSTLTPDSIKSELTKVTTASPTEFKENKDFAAFTFNIDSVSNFELPHTGEWNWNLQLGAVAAVMVSVLAAGFVASQTEACRKLLYERRRC
ncbi:hypothetical protein [Gardnerella vaginalis]|uniref:hypothetical protein n=1 Tax=Gardnerella vaginalis TaxID=2702 RepID=UPI000263541C|nr:hypothetical protein [Gardnerella vaginalis]EIK87156.1 hypothetical protein CGSMWGv6119V5_05806 [Gardnerella vaginalis 6119V5]